MGVEKEVRSNFGVNNLPKLRREMIVYIMETLRDRHKYIMQNTNYSSALDKARHNLGRNNPLRHKILKDIKKNESQYESHLNKTEEFKINNALNYIKSIEQKIRHPSKLSAEALKREINFDSRLRY